MFEINGKELENGDVFLSKNNEKYKYEVFSNDGKELKYFPIEADTDERSRFPLTEDVESYRRIQSVLYLEQ